MAIFTTERSRLRNIVSVALVAVVAIAGLATGMARMALSGLEKNDKTRSKYIYISNFINM